MTGWATKRNADDAPDSTHRLLATKSGHHLAGLLSAFRRSPGLTAFALYLAFSTALFGRAAAPRFSSVYMGRGIDQTFFIWCLVWWPYALAHHLNPFVTRLIFAPRGFNLTWSTSIPLLSFIAVPLTAAVGPIAAFNVICVMLPAVAAWSALMLCRYLGCRFWPSLMGGYVFGFSSYMLAHLLAGHLSLCAIFIVPLVVLVVLARLEQRISRLAFTFALMALLIVQFLICTEVLATMTLFGAIALALACAIGSHDLRQRVARLVGPVAVAYLGTAVLMSPYLYYVFAGFRPGSLYSPSEYSADLLNFVIPTATIEFGSAATIFGKICARFTGNISEQSAYLGLPMLAISGWFIISQRDRLAARLLGLMLVATMVAAMGPRFHVAGRASFKLPWSLFHHAPLIDQALPARFTMYSFLVLGLTLAMWLNTQRLRRWMRAGAAIIVLVSIFPNPAESFWANPARRPPPAFFTMRMYRRYLAPGETVAMLPYAWGESEYCMLWQAVSGMYFRLAGGYFPLTPTAYRRWPAINSSIENVSLTDPVDQWKAFAANHGVSAVIFAGAPSAIYARQIASILPALGPPDVKAGGVELFKLQPRTIKPFRGLPWNRMEALEDEQRFDALLIAAQGYLASGADPTGLSPESAVRMRLLSARIVDIPPHNVDYRVELKGDGNGRISVGLSGTYAGLHAVIDRYGSDALRIDDPFRRRHGAPTNSAVYRRMVMVLNRAGLKRAATTALENAPRFDPVASRQRKG
jgi:hypothetical protein